jgi:hypothetical protein
MYILYLFEAVFISHVLSLQKKGLECMYVLSSLCSETPVLNAADNLPHRMS